MVKSNPHSYVEHYSFFMCFIVIMYPPQDKFRQYNDYSLLIEDRTALQKNSKWLDRSHTASISTTEPKFSGFK